MRLRSLAVGCFSAIVFVPMALAAERSAPNGPILSTSWQTTWAMATYGASMPRARSRRPS